VVGSTYVYAWRNDGLEFVDGDGDPQTWGVLSTQGNTFTAGIGVIWKFSDISRWMEKEGYNVSVIKSGSKKDMGSTSRPLSGEEEEYAQQVVTPTPDSSSSGRSQTIPGSSLQPALLTQIYTFPNLSAALSHSAWACAGSATSQAIPRPSPPQTWTSSLLPPPRPLAHPVRRP